MDDLPSLSASVRAREESAPHAPAKLFGVDDHDVADLERTCAELGVRGRAKDELFFSDDQDAAGHVERVFRLEC